MIRIRKKDGSIDYAELTYLELIIAVVLLGIVGQLIIMLLPCQKFFGVAEVLSEIFKGYATVIAVSAGWWIGIGAAIFMATHLYNNVSDVVMMAQKDANDVLRHNMIIRYGIIFVIMVVIYLTKLANPVAYVVGVIMLKPAAYMQPLIDKIYSGILNKPRNEVD